MSYRSVRTLLDDLRRETQHTVAFFRETWLSSEPLTFKLINVISPHAEMQCLTRHEMWSGMLGTLPAEQLHRTLKTTRCIELWCCQLWKKGEAKSKRLYAVTSAEMPRYVSVRHAGTSVIPQKAHLLGHNALLTPRGAENCCHSSSEANTAPIYHRPQRHGAWKPAVPYSAWRREKEFHPPNARRQTVKANVWNTAGLMKRLAHVLWVWSSVHKAAFHRGLLSHSHVQGLWAVLETAPNGRWCYHNSYYVVIIQYTMTARPPPL